MSTIEDMVYRNKGEAICADLKRYGLKPVWLEAVAGRIAIGIEFISDAPTWTRAFYLPGAQAAPAGFIREINTWKNEMRRKIVKGASSKVLEGAIAAHGMMTVLDALEDTPMESVH